MESTTSDERSLFERADELRARFAELRRRLDLEHRIASHPLAAVGIALAAGALVGMRRAAPEPAHAEVAAKAGFGGAITGALTAVAMRLVKDAAIKQLSGAARTWYGKRQHLHGEGRERGASMEPATEAFARH